MSIRTILVGASGGTASDGAVELACRMSSYFGAHLEGYHIKLDSNEIIIASSSSGLGMPMDGAGIQQMIEDADKLAAKTKAAFFRAADRHGLAHTDQPPQMAASAGWHDETGRATALIAGRARFFDLVVLGRSDRVVDLPASDAIERTLLESGRPVLLAPATPPATVGETIAIGWDGSPRSVRAITASMSLLLKAKKTFVFTIGDKPDADVDAVSAYLRWHGIASDCKNLDAVSGVGPGEQLLSAARDAGADLLAMGAFGQAPWRQMLFGGATRTIVGTSLLPVLMTH